MNEKIKESVFICGYKNINAEKEVLKSIKKIGFDKITIKDNFLFGLKNYLFKGGKYYFLDEVDYEKLRKKKCFSLSDIMYGYIELEISEDGKISILRDGLGIKNLYYYSDESLLIISNDIKKILYFSNYFGKKLDLNYESLFNSLKYKTTLTFETLITEINVVDFGTKYTFKNNELLSKNIIDSIEFNVKKGEFLDNCSDYESKFIDTVEDIYQASLKGKIGIMFTGGVDSTSLLNAIHKKTNNIIAITLIQKKLLKEDDIFSIKFCKEKNIEHKVIFHKDSDIDLLPSVISSMEDLDISMSGLSLTIKKIIDFSLKKKLLFVISGSYIEPILGSNPQTLSFLKTLIQGKAKIGGMKNAMESFANHIFTDNYDYTFLAKKINLSDSTFKKITSIYKNIFSGKEYGFNLFKKENFSLNVEEKVSEIDNIIPNYLKTKEIELYNLLSYTDLAYRGHYRNSYVNERISISGGINVIHPFANRNLRNAIFDLPIEQKFNPSRNQTTVRDNKFFIKEALKDYIPDSLIKKAKAQGSIPSTYQWIYSEINNKNILKILIKLKSRNIFKKKYMLYYIRVFTLYHLNMKIDKDFISRKFHHNSARLWQLITLEIFLTIFIDKKFDLLFTDFNSISLKDII